VAVFGNQTIDMAVRITDCRFDDDRASGGAGKVDGTGDGFAGGAGEGGAVYLDAQNSTALELSVIDSRFHDDSATGGAGGNGRNGSDGTAARGGALYFTGATADYPTLNVAQSAFNSDSATGGAGGFGAIAADTGLGTGGNGGAGGDALGGAVYFRFASVFGSSDWFWGDTLRGGKAIGGDGGAGGFGGGNGAAGGNADGGAVALVVDANSGPTHLTITNSTIDRTRTRAGAGGTGGSDGGDTAGAGGAGGSASAGGLYLKSFGGSRADTWTLHGVDVTNNRAVSGDGGAGGSGFLTGTGGDGGECEDTYGGVYDGFTGTLKLFHCTITANAVLDGTGGAAGIGPGGHPGLGSEGYGGGIYIAPDATALAANTDILGNSADHHPNRSGHLGTI
jgi:hypothetical protein